MPPTESIILMGARRYRVDRDWCRWPAEVEAGRVSQIAVDAAGRVLVLQRGGPPVAMFDGSGEFLGTFGEGEILDPHGISAAADGRILIADRDAHQILVYDGDGNIVQRLGRRGEPAFGRPFNTRPRRSPAAAARSTSPTATAMPASIASTRPAR